jgi:uncharacterized membrane protein YedE/YeeE
MEITVWSGWLAGLAIGLFVVLHFWLIGKPAGCSTGYGNLCGLLSKRLRYFHEGEYRHKYNSKLWFLLGIPLGGLLSALGSAESWHLSFDMGLYDAILPQSIAAKAIWLTFGGMLLGFGARLAGACTTGHALVGGAMLNPTSLFAAAIFFMSAFVTTHLLFTL